MTNSGIMTEATTPAGSVLERGRSATTAELGNRAEWIRLRTIDLIDQAGGGHYSSTFSVAELYSVLYYHTMRLRHSEPKWVDRDRFLLGKGHAAIGLWPIFADLGFFPVAWLDGYGTLGSPLTDHPNMRTAPGTDFSSASLGHNLSVGVGIALAGRANERHYRKFVLTGDGEIQEGQVWEAAMAASHYGLGNLVAIVDANGYAGGDGSTSVTMNIEPIADRFSAFGWNTVEINGNDIEEVVAAFDELPSPSSKIPTCVIARTMKGKGVKMMELAPNAWHIGKLLTGADLVQARDEIESRIR